jgi:hypothetical protein
VIGKVIPETVKPLPATVAAVTVTAEVPVEDKVSVCVVAVFTLTLPNERLDVLTLSAIAAAPSCRPNVSVTPFADAVKVTACATLTADTVAAKVALVAPPATVTWAGTVNAGLLLATLTAKPPLAAAVFSVTVQLSVPAAVIDVFAQFKPVSTGTPVPLKSTAVEDPVAELLLKVSEPEVVPAAVGLNCTLSVAV